MNNTDTKISKTPRELKYIIFESECLKVPLTFPTFVEHKSIKICSSYMFGEFKPVSAGFCKIDGDKVECYGESMSLKLSSKPGDEKIIHASLYQIEHGHVFEESICVIDK